MSWLLALVSNPGCYSPLTGSFNLTLMSHVVECLTPYTPLSHCLLVSLPYHPGMGDFHVIHAEAHSSAEEFPPPLAHSWVSDRVTTTEIVAVSLSEGLLLRAI